MSVLLNAVGHVASLISGSTKKPLEDLAKPLLIEIPPQQEILVSQIKAPKTLTPSTDEDKVLQGRINALIGKEKPVDVYDAYMDQL